MYPHASPTSSERRTAPPRCAARVRLCDDGSTRLIVFSGSDEMLPDYITVFSHMELAADEAIDAGASEKRREVYRLSKRRSRYRDRILRIQKLAARKMR